MDKAPYSTRISLGTLEDQIDGEDRAEDVERPGLPEPAYRNRKPIYTRASSDPNDKVGAQGNGSAQHWVTSAEPLRYQIMFENQPSATAPAQELVITNQIDVTKFDLDTFELGPVAFGTNTLVTPRDSGRF